MHHEQQRFRTYPETPESFPIEAAIFDLDGLLVDTEELWFETCQRVLSEYGVRMQEKHRIELMGRGKLSSFFVERFGVQDSLKSISEKIWGTFLNLAEAGLKPMPGAVKSVKLLSSRLELGVASSAHTNYVEMVINQLGVKKHFKALIGGDQVEKAKPAPDVFLKTAALLRVDPKHCVVLEDSPNGLAAAKAANMFCLAVPNRYLQDGDFSQADLQIPSLESLDFETLQLLVDSRIKN